MGRYKSVLMATQDARDYPHHVDVPVPGMGLGKQLDVLESWLRQTFGAEWRQHGARTGGVHVARFMFRSRSDADLFDAALAASLIGRPRD